MQVLVGVTGMSWCYGRAEELMDVEME